MPIIDKNFVTNRRRKIASIQKRIGSLEGYLHAPSLPGSAVTGGSGQSPAYRRKLTQQIDRTVSSAVELTQLRERLNYLQATTTAYEQGEMHKNGRKVKVRTVKAQRVSQQPRVKDNGIKTRVDAGEVVQVLSCVGIPMLVSRCDQGYRLQAVDFPRCSEMVSLPEVDAEFFNSMSPLRA